MKAIYKLLLVLGCFVFFVCVCARARAPEYLNKQNNNLCLSLPILKFYPLCHQT